MGPGYAVVWGMWDRKVAWNGDSWRTWDVALGCMSVLPGTWDRKVA